MRDNSVHPVRSLYWLTRNLIVLAAFAVSAFAVVGYAAGWISFHNDQQQEKATIEIETGEMKADTRRAVERGKELVEQAGNDLRQLRSADDKQAKENTPSSDAPPTSDVENDSDGTIAMPPVDKPNTLSE